MIDMKIKDKPCKRKKCPHYKEIYRMCDVCEWNPKGVWIVRKKVEELAKYGGEYLKIG